MQKDKLKIKKDIFTQNTVNASMTGGRSSDSVGLILWVFFLLLAFSCGPLCAQEEAVVIGRVLVEGNSVVADSTILAVVNSRSGAVLDRELLADDAKRIVALPEIHDVQWRVIQVGQKVDIVFDVTESSRIVSVAILRNKNIATEKLLELLEFDEGDFIDPYLIRHGIDVLAEHYHEKGYYFARVDLNADLLNAERKIVYEIVEGPKLRIKKVEFQGNDSFGKGKLKVKTAAWFPIFSKGILDDDKLKQDKLAVASFYHDKGFLDAQVFVDLRFNDDKTRVTVVFVVDEGPEYKVGTILFQGNERFSSELLAGELKLKPGRAFTNDRRVLATRAVKRVMGRDGYIYATVDLVPQYTEQAGVVDVVFKINEGMAYDLGRVIVKGNYQTQDKVIRRELDRCGFLPGELYDLAALERAKRRIRGCGLFEDVTVMPIGNTPGSRDALVEVTETTTGLIIFGVGIDTNSGVMGNFSVQQRNFDITRTPRSWGELFRGEAFVGGGQSLSFEVNPGTRVTSGRIRFHEPYMFDQPYYLDMNLFIYRRSQESYYERRRGGQVSVGRRFDNDWYVDLGIRAELIKVTDLDDGYAIPGDPLSGMIIIAPQDVQDVKGDNFLTSIRLGIGRDTTDSKFRPTEGYKLHTNWEQVGAAGGNFEFSAVSAGAGLFHTIYEDLAERRTVLAAKIRGNAIVVGDAPVFERYYAGGIGTLRGFDYRGVSPRAGRNRDPIGSDYLFLINTELVHPLVEKTIFGKVFCDTGIIDEGPYRATVGFGFELLVPQLFQMVPMHFDFGFPLNFDDEDDREVFSFNFGMTF